MPFSNEFMDNPHADRVRHVASLSKAKARERSGLFLVEGPQSVRELVTYEPQLVKDLYIQAHADYQGAQDDGEAASEVVARILEHPHIRDIYVHYVSPEVMMQMSQDAQGIVAVADLGRMKSNSSDLAAMVQKRQENEPIRLAAFWEIRDPGNAGTVIRAADAAGCDAVIFVGNCVDASNPKVVRSTVGSLFHIPLIRMATDTFFTTMKDAAINVTAADVHGVEGQQSESLPELVNNESLGKDSMAVLFGNEARGLSDDILRRCQKIVYIPMYGKAESLNLATSAAIMLHTLAMSSHVGRI
ncbi:TrmH family RNA methyltransferase [Bifidobacterium aquikefiri]|uniref:TrmH family RNA methyltransferase n=1 Tax=Bifidobacterium aquikefiri TaxID=1653207 RepID=UPI0039ED109D